MPGLNLTREEATERASIISSVTRYEISLDLTRGDTDFGSFTRIEFDAREGASTFADLVSNNVHSITLNGNALDPFSVHRDNRIALENLAEHNILEVDASCQYMHTGEGLHRFVDPADGQAYTYSQFEVPDARRVYTTFEQPDLKSTFTLTVKAPKGWKVFSNAPTPTPEEEGEAWVYRFATTEVMSTYITAIVAGPYEGTTATLTSSDGRTIDLGVYARASIVEHLDADEIIEITRQGFEFFEGAYGIAYPFTKYDQIFVPEYNAGAMENAGCVTFRDAYVFRTRPTEAQMEARANTILHELAHMWFGDLVTMKWWNDLWLNESFAEFMSHLALAEATKYTEGWTGFMVRKDWGLKQDQLPTTHPITAEIRDLADVEVNFDGITYAKGASVLKQLAFYVGRTQFFEGIHNYLNRHAYSNATLADLLSELEKTSGRDLKAWSAKWLEESGINTIATGLTVNADGTIAELKLTQSAPAEHPVLRPHRLAVGFYNEDAETGKIVRTEQFELDVDGETTIVEAAAGKPRPAFVLVNDDDLTYTKIRFDAESQAFAEANLHRFDDALARAVTWLAFWDMTRDGEFPAERFVDMTLRLLATETESTTFRYALACMSTTAHHYVAPARRDDVLRHVAAELWTLANAAEAGSDTQFQLATAYLGYGEEGDAAFAANAHGLLDGTVRLEGLEIDNNFTWTIVQALTSVNEMTNDDVDAQLAKKETTENREFAYGARASMATTQAKEWAWDQALHNDELTNSQLEAVARGFSATPRPDLAEPFAAKYFETVDWVWANKTYHMADALLNGLYPGYADPATLVKLGDAWLDEHIAADNALKRLIVENVASSHRTLKVREYNEAL